MLFTDPPYGYSYESNMRVESEKFDVIMNDDKILDFITPFKKYINGFVFICTTWKVLDKWTEIFKSNFEMSNMIIWDKGGGGIGDLKKTFSTDYEIIMVSHNNHNITGKRLGSVWDVSKDSADNYIHPTQKPIELSMMAIENVTNKNDIIVDLFGGSGSTLIGCLKTDRICYTMELDESYCDKIIRRYYDYTFSNNIKLIRDEADYDFDYIKNELHLLNGSTKKGNIDEDQIRLF